MKAVKVQITRFVDDGFPGFVECQLRDVQGHIWAFIEKVPVVSDVDSYLDADSDYPQPGVIACEVIRREYDDAGREVVFIGTEQPWGVESIEGVTQFRVYADTLTEIHLGS